MTFRPLFYVLSLLFAVLTHPVQAQFTTGLEGYWAFDSDGGDSSINDRSLSFNGGSGFSTGLFGEALQLTGNSAQSAQRATDDSEFDFDSSDFTVQIWANFASTSGEQTLIEKFTGGAGPGWTLTKLSGNGIQFFADGATSIVTPMQTIPTSQWHQFVVRRDGTAFDVFFNGLSTGSSTSALAIADTSQPLLIGEREGSQQFPVNGLLDEAAIWSRALSNTEVTQLYNGGNGRPVIATIPEPSSACLLACALLVRVTRRRR